MISQLRLSGRNFRVLLKSAGMFLVRPVQCAVLFTIGGSSFHMDILFRVAPFKPQCASTENSPKRGMESKGRGAMEENDP